MDALQVIQWSPKSILPLFERIFSWIGYCLDAIKRLVAAIYEWLTECMYYLLTTASQWITLIFSWAAHAFYYISNGTKQAILHIYWLLTNAFLQLVFLLLLLALALLLLHLLIRLIILLIRDTQRLKGKLYLLYSWIKKALYTCWCMLLLTPLTFIWTNLKCLKLTSASHTWSISKKKATAIKSYIWSKIVGLYSWSSGKVITIWMTSKETMQSTWQVNSSQTVTRFLEKEYRGKPTSLH